MLHNEFAKFMANKNAAKLKERSDNTFEYINKILNADKVTNAEKADYLFHMTSILIDDAYDKGHYDGVNDPTLKAASSIDLNIQYHKGFADGVNSVLSENNFIESKELDFYTE